MRAQLRPTAVSLLLLLLVTGLAYPLAVTAIAQLAMPRQANGSLIERDGQILGSTLIGQPFDAPHYFWGRPSATEPFPYNAAASAGSNLGPSNDALLALVQGRIDALRAADAAFGIENVAPIPVDLVTASASGLDPHISPAAAEYQAARVAQVRGLGIEQVRVLIAQHTSRTEIGPLRLGEPRVDVLELNLGLDALQ